MIYAPVENPPAVDCLRARGTREGASERLTPRARRPNYCSGESLRRERLSAGSFCGNSCFLSFRAQRFPIIINHSGIRRRFSVALIGCGMKIMVFVNENECKNWINTKILANVTTKSIKYSARKILWCKFATIAQNCPQYQHPSFCWPAARFYSRRRAFIFNLQSALWR